MDAMEFQQMVIDSAKKSDADYVRSNSDNLDGTNICAVVSLTTDRYLESDNNENIYSKLRTLEQTKLTLSMYENCRPLQSSLNFYKYYGEYLQIEIDRIKYCLDNPSMLKSITPKQTTPESGSLWSPDRENEFLQRILDDEKNEHKFLHVLPLDDVVYCVDRGIPLLTPEAEYESIRRRPDYSVSQANLASGYADTTFPRQGRYHVVIVDKQDAALFDGSPDGEMLLKNFLQIHADHFFNPKTVTRHLAIYETGIADIPHKKSKINGFKYCAGRNYNGAKKLRDPNDFPGIDMNWLVDPGDLVEPRLLREYDMAPTWKNLHEFVSDDTGERLHLHKDNYDILRTLINKEFGYRDHRFVKINDCQNGLYQYSYESRFNKIANQLKVAKTEQARQFIRTEAVPIATEIMRVYFPDIRYEPASKENIVKPVIKPGKSAKKSSIKL